MYIRLKALATVVHFKHVVYRCILYQGIRHHRNLAISKCKQLPGVELLAPRRQVDFKHRGCTVNIKVSCVEEQRNLAIACALKGLAVESGLLKPIFAEDMGQNCNSICMRVAPCIHDVTCLGFRLAWFGQLCIVGVSCLPDPGRTSWCTLTSRS